MAFLGSTFKWYDGDVYYDSLTKKIPLVSGQDAIGQAVEHVILTQVGSHRMHPDFGTNLTFLASLPNPTTALRNRLRDLEAEMNFKLISFEVGERSDRNLSFTVELKYGGVV